MVDVLLRRASGCWCCLGSPLLNDEVMLPPQPANRFDRPWRISQSRFVLEVPHIFFEYIDKAFYDLPLLPTDHGEMAETRFWAKFFVGKVPDIAVAGVWTKGETQKLLMKDAMEHMTKVMMRLKEKRLFGGAVIGLVD
ncbi:hypothetical protein D1007_52090 [Hordeum vulgare]|nr:hypothetical protein D1007_52090 [Hordeum vulgare]